MHSKISRRVIYSILSITICIVCGIIWLSTRQPTEEDWVKTDIAQYSEIRGQRYNEALFGHFPIEIPPSATEVYMMYSPPFLQKGLIFQLWLKLPEKEIETLQTKYKDLASQNDGATTHLNRFYPALVIVQTRDNPQGEVLPKGTEIIVLGAESKDEGNHGHTYGVAINNSTSEILYWAEAW